MAPTIPVGEIQKETRVQMTWKVLIIYIQKMDLLQMTEMTKMLVKVKTKEIQIVALVVS